MKDIKDYLHLYLGCECKMTKPGYHAVHELGLSADTSFALNGKLLKYFIEPTTKAELKPFLRPLSDMTEDEEMEAKTLHFNLSEKDAHSTTRIEVMAGMTHWYLSKGFDLFGLIDAGLAINKTKLNNPG